MIKKCVDKYNDFIIKINENKNFFLKKHIENPFFFFDSINLGVFLF